MKATLIYNANARQTNTISTDEIQEMLRAAGYQPVYTPTMSVHDLDSALADAEGGLVVVAGGDGTIRAVAIRLLERDVPLSILPLGTANNIARTFGIEAPPEKILEALADPYHCAFDVGRVETPWGEHYFLEALGFGFYADTLAALGPEAQQEKNVLKAIGAIARTIPDYESHPFDLLIDGQEISGDYLLVEVLNTTAFGPRLKVAPKAEPGDGLFEIIRIREQEREGFASYMMSLFSEELDEMPSVEASQGRRLEVTWYGFPLHIDGEIHPRMEQRPSARKRSRKPAKQKVIVEVIPQALTFWLPHAPQK